MTYLKTALAILTCSGAANAADFETSFYMGSQSAPHSIVSVDGQEQSVGWEGRSFSPPPYYGLKAMWWQTSGWGFGAELTHTKVYANKADREALGFDRMEFTDGHNIVTANLSRRWDNAWNAYTPFVTAGVGVAIPHVDIEKNGEHTFGYQLTGPAVRLGAGISCDFSDTLGWFAEYQMTYSQNKAELDGGETFETKMVPNAINLGLPYKF